MTDRRGLNLELIKADDAPRVGVAEIDAQHATLIGLINRLHQAMIQRENRDTLGTIITELLEHTEEHFAYEETLMQEYDYPQYASHKADHDRLMRHMSDLADQFQQGDLLLSFAVMMDLKAWATIHIEKSDAPLGRYLGEKLSEA